MMPTMTMMMLMVMVSLMLMLMLLLPKMVLNDDDDDDDEGDDDDHRPDSAQYSQRLQVCVANVIVSRPHVYQCQHVSAVAVGPGIEGITEISG